MNDKIYVVKHRIKHYRDIKNMTLKELSAETGISIAFLNDLERNLKTTTIVNLAKIGDALDVEEKELFEVIRINK